MAPDEIRFSAIKEHRGWYFVEYHPPLTNYRFSVLSLTILESSEPEAVAAAMELEARAWLARFPVPIFATAFNVEDDVFRVSSVRNADHLIAWCDGDSNACVLHWGLVPDEQLPATALDRDNLLAIFGEVPYRTGHEIIESAKRYALERRVGWWLVFLWAVVVPLSVAVLEWYSDLLGLAVLIYAFGKAIVATLRMTGRLPKSERQVLKEAEELKKKHYYYHCERNPEAFEKLKLENFRRESAQKTLAEAAALKVDT